MISALSAGHGVYKTLVACVLQRFSSPTPPLGLMQDQDGVVKLYGRKRTRGQGYAANQRVVETQFPREVWEPRGPANMDKISV